MTDSVKNTESNKEQTTTETDNTEEVKTDVENESSPLDFYEGKKEEVKPEETKEEVKPEDEKTSTGYEDVEEKTSTGYEEETKEEVKPEETKEEDAGKKELEEAIKNLPENIDKEKIAKFALDNKLTKEQIEAYGKITEEEKNNEKTRLVETRKQWKEDLYKDPEFGGDSKDVFDKNIHKVDQILKKHMTGMKKALTDKGGVLPPYIMKDLLRISKILNPKTDLVQGEPAKVESKEENFLDIMYK